MKKTGVKFMVVMTGLGMSSELCMIGYSLVLAMNYLPGMAVITLNVIGDAATNVIVSFKEKVLNKDVYYKQKINKIVKVQNKEVVQKKRR